MLVMSGRASDGDVAEARAVPAESVAEEKPIVGFTKECMKRAGLPEGVAVPDLPASVDTRVGYAQPAGKHPAAQVRWIQSPADRGASGDMYIDGSADK